MCLARAALIEEHDPIGFGIEEPAVLGHQTGAGSTMEKHDWLTIRIAALFVIQFVNGRDSQTTIVVRFDLGIQVFHLSIIQRRNGDLPIGIAPTADWKTFPIIIFQTLTPVARWLTQTHLSHPRP